MKTRNQDRDVKEEHQDIKKRPAESSSESEGEDDQAYGGISEYEKQRLENIRRNQEAMAMFNLPEAVSAVSADKAKKARQSNVGVKKEKKVKTEDVPLRRSNRKLNIKPDDPVALENAEKYKEQLQTLDHHKRARRTGDLSLSDASTGHGDEKKFAKLMEEMATYVPDKARVHDAEDDEDFVKKEEKDDQKVKKEEEAPEDRVGIKKYFARATHSADSKGTPPSKPTGSDATSRDSDKGVSLRKQVQSLKIRGPWPIVKVCQGRIYCSAIHENRDKVLVCGGDIDGNLGFWDLNETLADDYEPDYDEEPNIYSYKAHSRTLSSMQYSPTEPTKLFTTSYDGSIRYLDLVKQQFIESYVVPSAKDGGITDHLGSISIDSTGNNIWFADNEGGVSLKDIRTPKDQLVYRKELHEKKVGCVNVNPKHGHLICTSSLDRTMRIWDVRKFGKATKDEALEEIAQFPHNLSVTSAMWSPDGASIASTSYDDNIRVFNNFDPALPNITNIPEPIKIRHNNQSGRWVTMLRAVWSFQFNWFCIGNMNSKAVEVYSRGSGDLMATLRDTSILNTVPAVNAWHPNRVVLASGMANGKMVIWR